MRNLKLVQKQGFTLMEIMVVIIVIAVLASVAGPMIGSITDQGRSSATKAQMQNLKTALVNYNNDLGKFPFKGTVSTVKTAYNEASDLSLATNDTNVLINETCTSNTNLNLSTATYAKRWKGPYMDSNPEEFMMDSWQSRIEYKYHNKMLYLHSKGPDGESNFDGAIGPQAENSDDIVMTLTRVKF